MKFTEIPNVGITNFWQKKTALAIWKKTRPLSLILVSYNGFNSWTFSQRYLFMFIMTPILKIVSIINAYREKCQIIKSQCWRFQARHKLWNSKRQEIPLSDERGINVVTKLAVWVQSTVKKNWVDDKNILHLIYPTCQKMFFFLY